jgi:hypothetical protein
MILMKVPVKKNYIKCTSTLRHFTHLAVSIKLQVHHSTYLVSSQRTVYSVTLCPLKIHMHPYKIKAMNQLAKSHQTYLINQETKMICQN